MVRVSWGFSLARFGSSPAVLALIWGRVAYPPLSTGLLLFLLGNLGCLLGTDEIDTDGNDKESNSHKQNHGSRGIAFLFTRGPSFRPWMRVVFAWPSASPSQLFD